MDWCYATGSLSTFKLGIKQKLCPYGRFRARGPLPARPAPRTPRASPHCAALSAPASTLSSDSHFEVQIQ